MMKITMNPSRLLSTLFSTLKEATKKEQEKEIPEYLSQGLKILADKYLQELHMAKIVQQALLSVSQQPVPGLKLSYSCTAAESIGGDFYTFVNRYQPSLRANTSIPGVLQYTDRQESRMGIAIGDVSGHGISSALVMALASGLFREIGENQKSPALTLSKINRELTRCLAQSNGTYVTAFYGIFIPQTKEFWYAKAGHPPAFVIRINGEIEFLEAEGIFLGMYDNETYAEHKIVLNSGDRVVLYTDGLTETNSIHGEEYGIDRLVHRVKDLGSVSLTEAHDQIFQDIHTFGSRKPIRDDQTLVLLQIE